MLGGVRLGVAVRPLGRGEATLLEVAPVPFQSPAHTRDLNWVMPVTGGPGFDGITDVAFSIRVTSDQPVVVGSNMQFGGFMPNVCSLLPK